MDGDSSMIVEAKEINGVVECKYEVSLECAACGAEVDAEEYTEGTCKDCGAPWDGLKHIGVHVTSVPATGESNL